MDKKQSEDFNGGAESIIGPSVKIDGDLRSQGNLRVDGMVLGKVKTGQNLYVGESANISADVDAENAVINGMVQGNIKVSGGLALGKTAKLMGDIVCGTLKVDEGAYFAGKCTMKDRPDIQPFSEAPANEKSAKK